MNDYFHFIGRTYQDLIKKPNFTTLITGNVPSRIDDYKDEFYITVFTNGLEFQFDSKTQKLKTIIASDSQYFICGLKNISSREHVYEILGKPEESMEEKTVPVLGLVGAWDKFKTSKGYGMQILYEVGSNTVKNIFYTKQESNLC